MTVSTTKDDGNIGFVCQRRSNLVQVLNEERQMLNPRDTESYERWIVLDGWLFWFGFSKEEQEEKAVQLYRFSVWGLDRGKQKACIVF